MSDRLRVGVLASGQGTNFQVLVNEANAGSLPIQVVVLVYNNPGALVAKRAHRSGVPAVLLNHRLYPSREALDQAIVSTLKAHGVDLVVMAGWMRVVTGVLIDHYPDRLLNIHPSLLPAFRGNRAIEQALEYGVKVTGCTVHLVRLEVDGGPVILQQAVPVLDDDTTESLAERIHAQEYRLLPEAVRLLASGRVQIEGRRVRILPEACGGGPDQ